VIELEGVPELVDPVMVAAFEGWNDAGDAASTAVGHMEREWKGEVFAALDAEDYYDFQVNRPQVWLDGGSRKITWPTTRLAVVRIDDAGGKGKPRDLVLVRGIEPSMRWRSFCNEILGFAHELGVEMVVVLGALLGDTPHSRPVPVTGVTSDPDLARTMNLEESRYEGPTGIVGILQEACTHAGVPAVSLWASVPHYVSQPPNPKATLALLNRLEDLLELNVPLGELQEDARAWQLGVDQLAAEDSEVAEYVQSLEEARDTAELPEASGEAIAKEFERYLRRRDGGTTGGARDSGHAPGPGQVPGPGGGADFGGDTPKRGTGGGRSLPSRRTSSGGGKDARQDKPDADDGTDADAEAGRDRKSAEDAEGAAGAADAEGTGEAKDAKDAKEGKGAERAKPTRRSGTTGTGRSGSRSTRGTGSTRSSGGTRGTGKGSRAKKPAEDAGDAKDADGSREEDSAKAKPKRTSSKSPSKPRSKSPSKSPSKPSSRSTSESPSKNGDSGTEDAGTEDTGAEDTGNGSTPGNTGKSGKSGKTGNAENSGSKDRGKGKDSGEE
jgi:proteasome assembly chaperone (PAC2) family protein